jgi:hypothetical protein
MSYKTTDNVDRQIYPASCHLPKYRMPLFSRKNTYAGGVARDGGGREDWFSSVYVIMLFSVTFITSELKERFPLS